ncbi:GGDEF domain-containing protein [Vibrio ponticus]|uniref:GGDEF domain-containing protein n=1 Tax=Vibrio ponticus TaxID=265668 RepID=A0A3N3DT73_9VIBR|nr:GGDEF and EAL domain-containing protein [Vibrio ponticus]ROV57707.1 GGDEF domain-containing protein [Vibrio ponticus]
MSKVNTRDLVIPQAMSDSWQKIVNLIAQLIPVPSALVMRIHSNSIEVFSRNDNAIHPYRLGDSECLGSGLYCEYVIENQCQLVVENALNDDNWNQNPDIKLGMISYCGFPINWPNGEPFGTICVLDNKPRQLSETATQLLESYKDSLEAQLATLYQNEQLKQLNTELQSRVNTRTQDLVDLNFSLNQEIDKRREAEKKVLYHQRHDLGTGFLNRNSLEYEAVRAVDISIEHPQFSVAAVHIGFSNGKLIQSKYGFAIWESILVQLREKLGYLSRYHLQTARPTSTELVFLIETSKLDEDIEQFCQHLIDVSHSEFDIEGESLHLHSYVGVSTTNDASSGTLLLQNACEAMRSCKDSGHKVIRYSEAISLAQKNLNHLESYLLQAVRSEDLLLYFQPKVSPKTQRWIGAEALLRWRHPILGDISNESLIKIAEKNGLIFEVGNFVLRSAIAKASEWSNKIRDFKIAVNISAVQLKDQHFAEQIEDLLTAYQLPADYLELEVTESTLIADEQVAQSTLVALHQLGVTLSLDDFGTGYSSFDYLKKYPFDAIKVDKSFIKQLDSNDNDKTIVQSIIKIAKKLELTITVEGIETPEHEAFIIEEDCEYGQGFFYGRPMPCDEFEVCLLNKHYPETLNQSFQ